MGEVIALSEERHTVSTPKILKISYARQVDVRQADAMLTYRECEVTARWASGPESPVSFWIEEDSDGDMFIGFRRLIA